MGAMETTWTAQEPITCYTVKKKAEIALAARQQPDQRQANQRLHQQMHQQALQRPKHRMTLLKKCSGNLAAPVLIAEMFAKELAPSALRRSCGRNRANG